MDIANPDPASKPLQRCVTCNARHRPGRLSLAYMLHRLREEVFGTERGLLLTIWHLFTRPQQVTSAFISGNSLRYYSPIKYFFVMFALSLIISRGTSFFDGVLIKQVAGLEIAGTAAVQAFFADWNSVIYLPLVLILAITTRGFFRAAGLNFAEHLVITTYGWAQTVLISTLAFQVLLAIKGFGFKGGWLIVFMLLAPAYWFWYCSEVFSQRNLAGWLRAFVTVPTAYVCFLFLFLAVMASIKLLQGLF